MRDKLISHLQEQGFEIEVNKDGDDTLVPLVNAENGDKVITFVFNKQGDLADVWNNSLEELRAYKDKIKEKEDLIKLGEAIQIIVKMFKR